MTLLGMPVLLCLCHRYDADTGLWVGAILFPLFAAGGFLVGHFAYARFGTRVCFDLQRRRIIVTGFFHPPNTEFCFDEVVAIQRINTRRGDSADQGAAWHTYQVNLVLRSGERYNLLDSGGQKQLDAIGEQIAQFLNVPFNNYGSANEPGWAGQSSD